MARALARRKEDVADLKPVTSIVASASLDWVEVLGALQAGRVEVFVLRSKVADIPWWWLRKVADPEHPGMMLWKRGPYANVPNIASEPRQKPLSVKDTSSLVLAYARALVAKSVPQFEFAEVTELEANDTYRALAANGSATVYLRTLFAVDPDPPTSWREALCLLKGLPKQKGLAVTRDDLWVSPRMLLEAVGHVHDPAGDSGRGADRAPPKRPPLASNGYLMRLDAAARELELEVADLLEFAEELDLVGAPLRVCVAVRGDYAVIPFPKPLAEPPGLKPADRNFAYIHAPNTPGFFYELADGAATLGFGDSLVMVDGSGSIWADGMRVSLQGLRVPRREIEALRDRSLAIVPPEAEEQPVGTSADPTRKRNEKCVARAKEMLAESPEKFARHDGKPVYRMLARALHNEGLRKDIAVDTLRDILRDNWG